MLRVDVKKFLLEETSVPVIDVRSPGEYRESHIPGAINLPLFTDQERASVGTTYTKIGKGEAIELGLEIVGPKMNTLAKKAKALAINGKLKTHCWRGGMRSEKMAWLFELIGLEVFVLEGGYKAFRAQLLEDFKKLKKIIVLQGPTGSGKTEILHQLQEKGEQIIDLERRANHKGSAFGALGMDEQPSTSQFQNLLYADLLKLDWSRRIWIESESLSIGRVYLPETLWENMNDSNVIELQIDRKLRARRVVAEYGHFDEIYLADSINKIRSRFGGNRVKESLELLKEKKLEEVALLLLDYYDKAYTFSKNKYKKKEIATLSTESDDPGKNALELIRLANNLNL
jgi:tRNA 2-selenouridine synthase